MSSKPEKYDIFISYRRDGGADAAKHLRDILTEKGYKVFYDNDSLASGDFNTALYGRIEECTDFLIILSPGSLDRCVNKNDWVRQELAYALKHNKNVIPVKSSNFHFPENLPEDIDGIRYKNAVSKNMEFFDAMVDKLISFLQSKPKKKNKGIVPVAVIAVIAAIAVLAYFIVQSGRNKKDIQPTAPEQQVSAPDEQASAPEAQGAISQADEEEAVSLEDRIHQWGDYVPSGTAFIETVNGEKYTAIANSLVLKSDEVEDTWADVLYKGLDNPSSDENSDDSDLISFMEMESVTRNGDKLDIVDIDGETRSLDLLEGGEILFIGEEDNGEAMSVYEKDIQSITFDRNSTPDTEIEYCTVKMDSGTYRSPVAFLWFLVNNNEGGGMPSMELCQNLSTYAGISLPVKRMRKITVTKNGNDSDMYVVTDDDPNPDQSEMTVSLTTGEEANITTGHYFWINTMAEYGAIREPSVSELREIDFE